LNPDGGGVTGWEATDDKGQLVAVLSVRDALDPRTTATT
jgi:hypothetical protein